MTIKTVLVIGNDKISSQVFASLRRDESVVIAIDRSTNIGRVFRLLRRGSLTIRLLLQMIYCELRRDKLKQVHIKETITRNDDLVNLIYLYAPQRVVLFRAGLIINKAVLATGVPIMNIHCAKIPEYGGIGSIAKALQENAFYQSATLHQVTEAIDQGIVFDTEPYELDPSASYCMNEDSAYAAGYRLLLRTIYK